MKELELQITNSFNSLKSQCEFEEGKILVVGCSSSEIAGSKIGTNSSYDIGKTVATTLLRLCKENRINLAAQSCEHLNRALVVEKELALKMRFEIVSAVPKPKAGGSFATSVYEIFENPVVVEYIKADYGMDIGQTMIGMHLNHVCIPVRLNPNKIGETFVTGAKVRAKLIGGERAEYK